MRPLNLWGSKSTFMPAGSSFRCLNIILASKLRLSVVLMRQEQITESNMSSTLWPGNVKWRPTGRSVSGSRVERKCSVNLSPKRLPVSPMYTAYNTFSLTHKMLSGQKIAAVSVSSLNRCRFLVMMFLASMLVGWYVGQYQRDATWLFSGCANERCTGVGQNSIAGLADNPLRVATASFLRSQSRHCSCTISGETDR